MRTTLIALTLLISVPAMAQNIIIEHYKHQACIVEDGEILPDYALLGTKSFPLRKDQYKACYEIVNRAIWFCENAIEPPYSWQEEDHPECMDFYKSQVPACRFHYTASQEVKCGILERAYRAEKAQQQRAKQRREDEKRKRQAMKAKLQREDEKRKRQAREMAERQRRKIEKQQIPSISESLRSFNENLMRRMDALDAKEAKEQRERVLRDHANRQTFIDTFRQALQGNLGTPTIPSYSPSRGSYGGSSGYSGSSGGADCERLIEQVANDYTNFRGEGMCQMFRHSLRVLKSYRNAMVSGGCTIASEWDAEIRQARQGISASCE